MLKQLHMNYSLFTLKYANIKNYQAEFYQIDKKHLYKSNFSFTKIKYQSILSPIQLQYNMPQLLTNSKDIKTLLSE